MAAHFQRGSQTLKPLAWYRDLAAARTRADYHVFMAEGMRAVGQIRAAAASAIEEILAVEAIAREAAAFSGPVRILTERQFKTISALKTPQGIAAVVRIPKDSYSARLPPDPGRRLLLLEGVQDPGNVGTLIRTAAGFGYDGIVLSDECADPFSPKSVQASAGSVLSSWIRRTAGYSDLAGELKRSGFSLFAADLKGEPVTERTISDRHVIMLGGEGAGLSDTLLNIADKRIRIPIDREKVESFNVAISGGILMFIGTAGKR